MIAASRPKGLFSISTKGTLRRPVIVVGPIALKIARNECGRA